MRNDEKYSGQFSGDIPSIDRLYPGAKIDIPEGEGDRSFRAEVISVDIEKNTFTYKHGRNQPPATRTFGLGIKFA